MGIHNYFFFKGFIMAIIINTFISKLDYSSERKGFSLEIKCYSKDFGSCQHYSKNSTLAINHQIIEEFQNFINFVIKLECY